MLGDILKALCPGKSHQETTDVFGPLKACGIAVAGLHLYQHSQLHPYLSSLRATTEVVTAFLFIACASGKVISFSCEWDFQTRAEAAESINS